MKQLIFEPYIERTDTISGKKNYYRYVLGSRSKPIREYAVIRYNIKDKIYIIAGSTITTTQWDEKDIDKAKEWLDNKLIEFGYKLLSSWDQVRKLEILL